MNASTGDQQTAVDDMNVSIVDVMDNRELLLGYSLISAEFALHLFLLPLTALNFYAIVPTSIMHRNLKFILLCQNSYILLFTLSRLVYISLKFAFGAFWGGVPHLKGPMFFSVLFGNWIGHVLLIERLIATFFVRSYERSNNPWFSICWLSILLFISLNDTYNQIIQSADIHVITLGTLVHFTLLLFCSFIEFIMFSILASYNESSFKRRLLLSAVHNLSERYPLSENVRTTRQLRPALFAHFVNLLLSSTVTYVFGLNAVKSARGVEMMLMLFYLGTTLANLFIVVTVVGQDPLLRSKVRTTLVLGILSRLRCAHATATVGDVQQQHSNSNGPSEQNHSLRRTDEYFKALNVYWA